MRIQVVFLKVFLMLMMVLGTFVPKAHSNLNAHATPIGCFDFKTKVISPLKDLIPSGVYGDSGKKFGKDKTRNEMTWAAVNGLIKAPISQVYERLLDHKNTASPKVDEIEVEKRNDPNYLEAHRVKFLIKPFFPIKIRWTEQWGYALAEGTPQDPVKIVISYHKEEGTSYIEHLCGSIVLRKLDPLSTEVYQYEEAKATQRSPEDTLNGLVGTLKMLEK